MPIELRHATVDDASSMAQLANLAGEGLPEAIWRGSAQQNETPIDVGTRAAASESGIFSWKNAVVAELDGEIAGLVVSHLTGAKEVPLSEDTHPILRPLTVLENKALETRHVNLLATFKAFRGRGVAHMLMEHAISRPGANGVSVIATDQNSYGVRFYEDLGFTQTAQAPVIKTNWNTASQTWYLMQKP